MNKKLLLIAASFKASETLLGIETPYAVNEAQLTEYGRFKASETLLGIETLEIETISSMVRLQSL